MKLETKVLIEGKIRGFIGISCIILSILLLVICVRMYGQMVDKVASSTDPPEINLQNDSERITRLETEYENLDKKVDKLDPIITEQRLTRLESALDVIKNLLIALITGIGLMLLETAHRLLVPRAVKRAILEDIDAP